MKLKEGDEVISIAVAREDQYLLLLTELGYGKRVQISDYPCKGRATQGVITFKGIDQRGKLVAALNVRAGQGIMLITSEGTITRQQVDQIGRYGRPAQGVRVMKLRDGHRLVSVARVIDSPVGVEPSEQLDVTDTRDNPPAPAMIDEPIVDDVAEADELDDDIADDDE
jgi:DNA gyrase subunit A